MPSQTALHPGREERLLATKSRGSAPGTHPAAVNDSRAVRGPGGRQGGLHGAPDCASSPKNSTAVTAFPMVNHSLICSAVSCRSMMAAARGPCLAPLFPPRVYTAPLPALGPAPPLARDPEGRAPPAVAAAEARPRAPERRGGPPAPPAPSCALPRVRLPPSSARRGVG